MWILIRVVTVASCSTIARDFRQTTDRVQTAALESGWFPVLSGGAEEEGRCRMTSGSTREVPGRASSGTRRGGRCRRGRSPCAAGTRGGSCARTARSGAGSSLRGTHRAQHHTQYIVSWSLTHWQHPAASEKPQRTELSHGLLQLFLNYAISALFMESSCPR